MTKIFLVRHGEQKELPGDPNLSPQGIVQAQVTGRYLVSKNIHSIISSPYNRTLGTAKIISEIINIPFSVKKELRERINFGDVKNQKYWDFISMCELSSQNRNYILPNGETSISCGNRLKNFICNLLENQNYILVTHGGIITDFLRNVFTSEIINNVYKKFTTDREIAIKHASITEIEWEDNKFKVNSIGYIPEFTKQH